MTSDKLVIARMVDVEGRRVMRYDRARGERFYVRIGVCELRLPYWLWRSVPR